MKTEEALENVLSDEEVLKELREKGKELQERMEQDKDLIDGSSERLVKFFIQEMADMMDSGFTGNLLPKFIGSVFLNIVINIHRKDSGPIGFACLLLEILENISYLAQSKLQSDLEMKEAH